MQRRAFLTLLGGAAAVWPLAARAQQADGVRRIGVLMPYTKDDPEDQARIAALQEGLRRLGWTEGRNLQLEYRWYAGDAGRARMMAKELIDLRPELIFVGATPGLVALRQETRIPILFAAVADPVDQGLVESLARPGGNATGFTMGEFSVGTKMLEVLKQIAPNVMRAAIMYTQTSPFAENYLIPIEAGAPSLGVEVSRAPIRDTVGIESAMTALGRDAGLLCLPDTFLARHRDLLVGLAARNNLPVVYYARFFAQSGGLISYGVNFSDVYRQSAIYIDRILRGEKPADLPVQQPIKYDLVINMKTAKALGLDVPITLQAIADEVIE